MHIVLGSDHAGLALKQEISALLQELGHSYADLGPYDAQSVDYPDYARAAAEAVAQAKANFGILICATGIGMSIAANKVPGVRAALCHEPFSARRAREHNDANVLCLGELIVGKGLAREIVQAFLATDFSGGRHARRVGKISAMERGSILAQ